MSTMIWKLQNLNLMLIVLTRILKTKGVGWN